MNTCWKCGESIPEGKTECDHGCKSRMSEEDTQRFEACLKELARRQRLDWTRVRSLDDLLCVLSTLFGDATVEPNSPIAQKLEKFLESPAANQKTEEP